MFASRGAYVGKPLHVGHAAASINAPPCRLTEAIDTALFLGPKWFRISVSHERFSENLRRGSPDGFTVQRRILTHLSQPAITGHRIIDETKDWRAAACQRNQRPVNSQATDKRLGAIDWIDNPNKFLVQALSAELFSQYSMIGEPIRDTFAEHLFHCAIRLGHGAGIRFGNGTTLAGGGCANDLPRYVGDFIGEVGEKGRVANSFG